jgi:hypothetical protein
MSQSLKVDVNAIINGASLFVEALEKVPEEQKQQIYAISMILAMKKAPLYLAAMKAGDSNDNK